MSNFSFSHNVFKSCILLMRQNEYLWIKGLTSFFLQFPQYQEDISGDLGIGQRSQPMRLQVNFGSPTGEQL